MKRLLLLLGLLLSACGGGGSDPAATTAATDAPTADPPGTATTYDFAIEPPINSGCGQTTVIKGYATCGSITLTTALPANGTVAVTADQVTDFICPLGTFNSGIFYISNGVITDFDVDIHFQGYPGTPTPNGYDVDIQETQAWAATSPPPADVQ